MTRDEKLEKVKQLIKDTEWLNATIRRLNEIVERDISETRRLLCEIQREDQNDQG